MKKLFLLGMAMSHFCSSSQGNEVAMFNNYKQAFTAFFCEKALRQCRHDIADCCGRYGLGHDWQNKIATIIVPAVEMPTVQDYIVACAVAQDMVRQLPSIAQWLQENAH